MMMRKRSCLVVVFFFFAIVLFLSASTTKIFLVSAVHSDDDEKNDDEGKTKEKEESWQDKDRDEYGLPICHDETLRRSPLRRATGGEIAAKMSQAKRYVDGHVRVSRDGKEMHVDVKVIRVKGNLNVGRNLYFEGEVKVEGSVIMGNKKDALEEIKRLENEIEEMTAIVEELEGHHTLTDENFHTAIENCLTMNNGQHRKDGACEALHYGERIGDWDVGKVSNFTRAFTNRAEFNADLSRWNTSSAKSFDGMFENAVAFNGDVSKWKSKSATTPKCFETRLRLKVNICAQSTPTRLKIYLRARTFLPTGSRRVRRRARRVRRRNRPHRRHQNRPNPFHLRDWPRRRFRHLNRRVLRRRRRCKLRYRNRLVQKNLIKGSCRKSMDGTSYYRKTIQEPHKSHTSITTGRRLESRTKDLGFKSNTRRINSRARVHGALWEKAIRLEKTVRLILGTLSLRKTRTGSISCWIKPWTCVKDLYPGGNVRLVGITSTTTKRRADLTTSITRVGGAVSL